MRNPVKNIHIGWIFFVLLVLWNPLIHVIDVFPDFLAWFTLAILLTEAGDICPYFDEAKRSAVKLGFVSLFKTVSIFYTVSAAAKGGSGDTTALFALCFAVVDLLLLFGFIRNVFEGLFYLGERSDALALIRPFGRTKPETVQTLCYVFFGLRSAFSVLPEFLRLTNPDLNDAAKHSLAKIYPYCVVIGFAAVAAVGIVVFVLMMRYMKAVRREGKFYEALQGMREGDAAAVDARMATKRYQIAFITFSIASLFTVSFPLDNISGMDALPVFMFGVLSLFGLLTLQKVSPLAKQIKWIAVGFATESFGNYVLLGIFLDRFGYDKLTESAEAGKLFGLCRIFTVIEGALGVALVAGLFFVLRSIIYRAMGELPESPKYSRADRDFHRALQRRNLFLALLGSLTVAANSVSVILRGVIREIPIDPSLIPEGSATESLYVTGGVLPWFGAVQVIVAIVFVFAVFNILGTYKAEVLAKAEAYSI